MQLIELQSEIITTPDETKIRYLMVLQSKDYRRYVEIQDSEFLDLVSDLKEQLLLSSKTKAVISEQITKIKFHVK